MTPGVTMLKVRDDFADEFLIAYARFAIAFGRLEAEVKLAIKNLAVALEKRQDFFDGMREAEEKEAFKWQCRHMLNLHRERYPGSAEGDELTSFVGENDFGGVLGLATYRNRLLHGLLTHDEDGQPYVYTTRWNRKKKDADYNFLPVTPDELVQKRHDADGARAWLHERRKQWKREGQRSRVLDVGIQTVKIA